MIFELVGSRVAEGGVFVYVQNLVIVIMLTEMGTYIQKTVRWQISTYLLSYVDIISNNNGGSFGSERDK